jgi:hypothetical protein
MNFLIMKKILILFLLILLCALNVLSQNNCTCDDVKKDLLRGTKKDVYEATVKSGYNVFLMGLSDYDKKWGCWETFHNLDDCEREKRELKTNHLINCSVKYFQCIQCNASKASENNAKNSGGVQSSTIGGAGYAQPSSIPAQAANNIIDTNDMQAAGVYNNNEYLQPVEGKKGTPDVVLNPFMDPDLYINQEQKTMIPDEEKN